MVIKSMGKYQIEEYKLNAVKKRLVAIEQELVDQLKISLSSLMELEHLQELAEYIDDLIRKWEEQEVELTEDDLDDLLK